MRDSRQSQWKRKKLGWQIISQTKHTIKAAVHGLGFDSSKSTKIPETTNKWRRYKYGVSKQDVLTDWRKTRIYRLFIRIVMIYWKKTVHQLTKLQLRHVLFIDWDRVNWLGWEKRSAQLLIYFQIFGCCFHRSGNFRAFLAYVGRKWKKGPNKDLDIISTNIVLKNQPDPVKPSRNYRKIYPIWQPWFLRN